MDFEKAVVAIRSARNEAEGVYRLRRFAKEVIADYERKRWEASYKALLEIRDAATTET